MAPPSTLGLDALGLVRAGRFREALPLAERAVADVRTCVRGHGLLATILLQLGRRGDAERVVSTAMQLGPGSAEAYDGLAHVSMLLDRHDRASLLYRRATELAPDISGYWYNLACGERSLGRLAEAEAACDRCIAIAPSAYPTYLVRSELRVQTAAANHIEELQGRIALAAQDPGAQAYLGYALAKELDDVGRFEEAFRWFATAAKARRSQISYAIDRDERTLRRIAEVFPGLARVQSSNRGGARCIFVVGLPRSGTTLVERILGGLERVRSNGETENVARALTAAARGTGDMFERAAAADPSVVAAKYAKFARLNEREWVIEKLPTNYLYLGAIWHALPEARLLLVRRSPLDSCFAMFRTLFGHAFPFSYDFEELARYYAAYDRLMAHWRAVLGDSLQEITYEDLVKEPRRCGENMARRCGLPWSDHAIEIDKNRSISLTASASQVRRPIYGSSSGRWRYYRRELAPLIRALRDRGITTPDDA